MHPWTRSTTKKSKTEGTLAVPLACWTLNSCGTALLPQVVGTVGKCMLQQPSYFDHSKRLRQRLAFCDLTCGSADIRLITQCDKTTASEVPRLFRSLWTADMLSFSPHGHYTCTCMCETAHPSESEGLDLQHFKKTSETSKVGAFGHLLILGFGRFCTCSKQHVWPSLFPRLRTF